MRRTAALLAVPLMLLALPQPATAQTPRPAPTIAWGPCDPADEAPERVVCAEIDVPVDWSKTNGSTVTIALAKLPATDQARSLGPLLINPGGPGGSGVNFAYGAADAFSTAITDRFDIIGFDPRGQARSNVINCDLDAIIAQSALLYPKSGAEFSALREANRALVQTCSALSGPLVKFADTASVARDMDAIRAGLGVPKISYYGVSYGTMIGQQYAELFPGRIRAMTLDSNMDHAQNIASYQKWETLAMEDSFLQFTAWCDRTAACALHDEGALAYYDALYARAEDGDLVVDGWQVKPEELLNLIFGYLYDPAGWFFLAEDLLWVGGDTDSARSKRGEPVPNGYLPVMCSDFRFELGSYAQLRALEKAQNRLAPHTRLNPLAWTDLTGCQNWPYRVTNPPHKLKASPKLPPILLSNSRYDVATPYQWGQSLASQLPSATFLTYDGVGHGTYWLSPCAQAAIDTYLVERRTPAKGSHCPAVFPTSPSSLTAKSGTQYPLTPGLRGVTEG
ncbi:alpha/beta hydrolase [Actinoplanes derwentensis]|uniref:Alpha/beta hydrolase fold n=1 Tax=Actinoplanes derwentensis TaxID=113562 RepID=A0A1H2A277_9ACTN|nr:alpha/beta hydrolase [Actinoplanes derwentensis]GID83419.1 peptidase [Actinoplanes derwentensis]SDT39973.1 alpha/beta hydrolase fold [Actinoplanes derwentensis]